MNIFRSIKQELDIIKNKRLVFVDDYNPDMFCPVMDVNMFADGNIAMHSIELTGRGGKFHVGFITGQGYDFNFDEDGLFAVATKVLANYLPPDPVLADAKKDLDIAMQKFIEKGGKTYIGKRNSRGKVVRQNGHGPTTATKNEREDHDQE